MGVGTVAEDNEASAVRESEAGRIVKAAGGPAYDTVVQAEPLSTSDEEVVQSFGEVVVDMLEEAAERDTSREEEGEEEQSHWDICARLHAKVLWRGAGAVAVGLEVVEEMHNIRLVEDSTTAVRKTDAELAVEASCFVAAEVADTQRVVVDVRAYYLA